MVAYRPMYGSLWGVLDRSMDRQRSTRSLSAVLMRSIFPAIASGEELRLRPKSEEKASLTRWRRDRFALSWDTELDAEETPEMEVSRLWSRRRLWLRLYVVDSSGAGCTLLWKESLLDMFADVGVLMPVEVCRYSCDVAWIDSCLETM